MRASEAKELANKLVVDAHQKWLNETIDKIKKKSIEGYFETQIKLGEGSMHNPKFSEEVSKKRDELKKLGYRTNLIRVPVFNTFFSINPVFDYYMDIIWD